MTISTEKIFCRKKKRIMLYSSLHTLCGSVVRAFTSLFQHRIAKCTSFTF